MCGYNRDGDWIPCRACETTEGQAIQHWFNQYGGYAAPSDQGAGRGPRPVRAAPPSGEMALRERVNNVKAGAAAGTFESGTAGTVVPVYPNARHGEETYQPHGEIPDPLDPAAVHSWPLHVAGITRQLERLVGVLMVHEERFEQFRALNFTPSASQNVGDEVLVRTELGFRARSVICDNPTSYAFFCDTGLFYLPPQRLGYVVRCYPPIDQIKLTVAYGSAGAGGMVVVRPTESFLEPG